MKAFDEAVEAGDEAAIRAAGMEVGKAMANGALNRIQMKAAVKAVLTPEQVARLDQMKDVAGQPIRRPMGDRMVRPWPGRVNQPGKVGRPGVPARLGGGGMFQRMDRNRDGAVTQREFNAFQGQNTKDRPARTRKLN